jgi:hypothetical protein
MVLTGFGLFMTGATINTILQSVIDDDKRSRVMSYYTDVLHRDRALRAYFRGLAREPGGRPAHLHREGTIALFAGLAFASQLRAFRRAIEALSASS